MPMNIQANASQPVTAGQGGITSSTQITSEQFGSLFATLLALTTPGAEQANGTSPANGAQNTALLNNSGVPLPLAADGAAGDGSDIDTLIAGLVDLLAKLQNTIAAGETVDPELSQKITASLDALTAQLNPPQTNAQLAAKASLDATLPAPAPGMIAADETPQQNTTPVVAKADAPATPATIAATKLAELAQQLTADAPDLAARLEQLAQKITQHGATQQAVTTAPAKADPEIASALALVFGKKPDGAAEQQAPSSKPAQSVSVGDQADRMLTKAEPSFVTADARQNQNADKSADRVSPSAIATAVASTTANTSEKTAPTDPLLTVQTTGQPATKADFATAIKPMTAAYQQPSPNLNMPHIAFEMVRQFRDGASRFQIRLDPPEMGRIDVKMDVDGTGNIHARLSVERSETLDLLQRDARALERALGQAGLDGAKTNLEFSLKQNPFARQDGQSNGQGFHGQDPKFGMNGNEDGDPVVDMPAIYHYRGTASPGGINMLA